MIEARKIEIEVRKMELMNIASKFVQEITGDLFIIHEYAENSDDINQKDLMEVHNAVFSRSAVKSVLFGRDIPSMPTPNDVEENSDMILIDSEEDDEETTDESDEDNAEEQHKKRRFHQVSESHSSTSSSTTSFNQDTQGYTPQPDAIKTITSIVKDAVVATFVRTIEDFFDLEKQKAINDRLLQKKIKQEANDNAAATANETEKVLKELENGKSLKDLIEEHMKNNSTHHSSSSSKDLRGVSKNHASLKKKNIKGKKKKKNMDNKKKDNRSKGKGKGSLAASRKNDSENAKPDAPQKNMRKEKKKKAPSKQKS